MDANLSLDERIEASLAQALQELEAFKLKPILKAIEEHPEGVKPGDFKNQKYEGIDMTSEVEVGDAMKKTNAIVYRIDLKHPVYQMLSTRHKTALNTYDPVINYDVFKIPNPNPNPMPISSPNPKAKLQKYIAFLVELQNLFKK